MEHFIYNYFGLGGGVTRSFYQGLTESDPLVNVIDVGTIKEAADDKIKGKTSLLIS